MKSRLLSLSLFVFYFLSTTKIQAQVDADLVKAGDVLASADLYWMMGKYGKAETEYKKVTRNDTSYALVLRNLALTYTEDKEDSLCMLTCRTGLALNSEYSPDFYNSLGISLTNMEKYDTALATFDEGLRKYPYRYLLYYNKGKAYFKMKKYPEAQKCFETSASLNPFHDDSHFMLGKSCAEQGRLVPAILSYEYYLLLDHSSERSAKVVSALEDLYTGDYQPDPDLKLTPEEAGDQCFSEIEELITSQVALGAGYKNNTKINLKMVKQFQAILEKLEYKPNTGNWWMDTYVPFFIAVQNNGYLVAYESYTLFSVSGNNASVGKSYKKNKKKIMAFKKWVVKYIEDHANHPAKELCENKEDVHYEYYDNNMIYGVGHKNAADKEVGPWIFFYSRSGHVSVRGSFDDKGERDGEWNWVYGDGSPKEKTTYVHGKREGKSTEYFNSGLKKFEGTFVNDLLEGEYTIYDITGAVTEKATMKAGKVDGTATGYYSNGTKKIEIGYTMGKMNGDLIVYSANGKEIKRVVNVNGKRNGHSIEYYNTGKTKIEGDYKNDNEFGPWKYYWDNGKVLREGKYKEGGLKEGEWKEYNRDGTLSMDEFYSSGKENGKSLSYDIDGKLYCERMYAAGKVKKLTFYNKKGEVINEYNTSKEVSVVEYYPSGIKSAEGDYVDGNRSGDWKVYSSNGGWLRAKEHYRRGYRNGTRKEYYRNGKLESELDYSMGAKDGYLKSYYTNGNIESEGWYVDDNPEGDWYGYNERGIMTSHRYFMQGGMINYQEYFDAKGKKDEEDYLKEGFYWSRTRYDSTGAVVYKFETVNGTGLYEYKFPNGQPQVTEHYYNGELSDTVKCYHYNGEKSLETYYLMGNQQGHRTEYYDNGKVSSETDYYNGERHGASNAWWKNGNKRWEENYYSGDLDGHQKYYYENGTLQREGTWDMGTLNGELRLYSDDGLLEFIRYYSDGNLLGYSYPDKDGNPVPMIKLDDASGKFTAYFQNGNKSIEGTYLNGRFDGKVTEYFSDGKVSEDENYVIGDLEGLQKYYYHNGNLKSEITYFCDKLDGVNKFYSEDGKLEHTETVVLGDAYGTWMYYNPDGSVKMSKVFYDDRQLSETKPAPVAPTPDPKGKPKPKNK